MLMAELENAATEESVTHASDRSLSIQQSGLPEVVYGRLWRISICLISKLSLAGRSAHSGQKFMARSESGQTVAGTW